ncbi:hypothetical protein VZT92_011315 [Zoarces viviparus]|uniref:Uncharacterized protein n=1 Tax=Zoarces viviparus TaxID=48416 RepID=A0AAW1FEC5_ZOAVI
MQLEAGPPCSWRQVHHAAGGRSTMQLEAGPPCSWRQAHHAAGGRPTMQLEAGPPCSWSFGGFEVFNPPGQTDALDSVSSVCGDSAAGSSWEVGCSPVGSEFRGRKR